ncbi:hypothetical protein QFC22_000780 [Naganishia vaughanmartiniae]|uniref:Uncharacterized protein n=1 Tax=Naganishia vaughanmartiniae TaxID=1424756 RepID=A0ACC2XJF7_9TREE|nr:hypothetical protein QFC22_000780 [Naganishia vaughanmartiniae]
MSSSAQPSQLIIQLARGVISILDLWPALRLALSEKWAGDESAQRRTDIQSYIIDVFEDAIQQELGSIEAATSLQASASGSHPLDDVVDQDELADCLIAAMQEAFEVDLEDGSDETVAKDIIKLWKQLVRGNTTMMLEVEALAASKAGQKVKASGQDGEQEVDEDGNPVDDDEDEDMETDDDEEDAPKLVDTKANEPKEPVVDEDGFTLVQKGSRKSGR